MAGVEKWYCKIYYHHHHHQKAIWLPKMNVLQLELKVAIMFSKSFKRKMMPCKDHGKFSFIIFICKSIFLISNYNFLVLLPSYKILLLFESLLLPRVQLETWPFLKLDESALNIVNIIAGCSTFMHLPVSYMGY